MDKMLSLREGYKLLGIPLCQDDTGKTCVRRSAIHQFLDEVKASHISVAAEDEQDAYELDVLQRDEAGRRKRKRR